MDEEEDEKTIENAKTIEKHYAMFEPFFEERDRTSYMAQYGHLIYLSRRYIIVLAIILIEKQADSLWQIIIFLLSSLVALMFNCGAKPFESRYNRYVETFNEIAILLTTYLGTQLVMSGRSVTMLNQIGYTLVSIIAVFLTVSVILLTIQMLLNIRFVLLKMRKSYLIRKYQEKIANKLENGD